MTYSCTVFHNKRKEKLFNIQIVFLKFRNSNTFNMFVNILSTTQKEFCFFKGKTMPNIFETFTSVTIGSTKRWCFFVRTYMFVTFFSVGVESVSTVSYNTFTDLTQGRTSMLRLF